MAITTTVDPNTGQAFAANLPSQRKAKIQIISAGVLIDGVVYGVGHRHRNEPVIVSERFARELVGNGKAKYYDPKNVVPSKPARQRVAPRRASLDEMVASAVGTAVEAVLEAQRAKDEEAVKRSSSRSGKGESA